MGVHCIAHRANLVVQSLFDLIFIARLESFMTSLYGYFNHSPKRHLECQRLAQTLEATKNKILKIVKIRWMSMLEPLKRIMAKHHPLL
jgi:hypothetical protein